MDLEAAVLSADGGDVLARLGGEVVETVEAALLAQIAHHVLGHPAPVEAVATLAGDHLEGLGELGKAHHLARPRGLVAHQQEAPGVVVEEQLLGAQAPVVGGARVHREALLGVADGGLEQPVEAQGAVILDQGGPGVDGAGHGDGVRAGDRDGVDAALEIPLGRRRGRGPARAVEGDDPVLAPGRVEYEAVAADAGGLGLDDREHGGSRDRRVDRVAALAQDLDGHQGRRRLGGRGHGAQRMDGGTARELKVTHARGAPERGTIGSMHGRDRLANAHNA